MARGKSSTTEFKKPLAKVRGGGVGKPKATPKSSKDEDSSSLSFEEDSASESYSFSSDLSSSATDEFEANKLEIKLDAATKKKIVEKLAKSGKKDMMEIKASDPRGVIYLGSLPYGFFEAQMRTFFTQFGVVTRLRLSRNKKTGKSKHYAFVEFLDPIVATIVADTMNGYMMYHRIIKCKVVDPEKIHPKMFKGANKRYMPQNNRQIYKDNVNKVKRGIDRERVIKKLLKKEEEKRELLASMDIDYEFEGVAAAYEAEKKTNPEATASPEAAASTKKKASPATKKTSTKTKAVVAKKATASASTTPSKKKKAPATLTTKKKTVRAASSSAATVAKKRPATKKAAPARRSKRLRSSSQ
eukprot:TRINITY_DN743_c7_g1_i1.p1 TRINITY_DN743_c7_g1~~TRINITY_DN743_c7_g1_i1.p1  ORF type:complete len:357 (-),score=144.78 TRINITY_DN743_c7_g1_i1:21-1091(-)